MTLVLTAAANRKFVAMSSDTRRVKVYYWHDFETGIYTKYDSPLVKEEGRFLKVIKLSDNVLLGVAGNDKAGDFIKEAMAKFVLPSDDLSACKKKLEFIIQQGRTDPTFRYTSLLYQKNELSVLISGFYYNGDTGNVTYESGEEISISEAKTNAEHNWQYGLVTPVAKYMGVAEELFDMPWYSRMMKAENIKKIKWIHKLISDAHPVEVSSDGVIYVLTRQKDGSIEYAESEYLV